MIILSVMLLVAWPTVWADWRRRRIRQHSVGQDNSFARKRDGMLPVVVGVTFFLAGFWILYFSPTAGPQGDIVGVGRYVAGSLIGVGCIFVACFLSIYWFGRPRFMIPPSMRPEQGGGTARIAAYQPEHAAPSPEWSPYPDEHVVRCFPANHVQGHYLCRGRLFVTGKRLVYVPGPHSAASGGVFWETALDQVSDAGYSRRDLLDPWGGGWRRRLSVRTSDGRTEYFVVWRPRKVAGLVTSLLAGGAANRAQRSGW